MQGSTIKDNWFLLGPMSPIVIANFQFGLKNKPLHGFGSFFDSTEETVAAAARVRSRKSLRGEVQECLQGGLNWSWFAVVPIGLSTATHESMEDTPLLKCFLLVVFYCRVIISWHSNRLLVPCWVILHVVFEHDSWGCITIWYHTLNVSRRIMLLSLLISLASLVVRMSRTQKSSLVFVFLFSDGCKWFSCVVQEALFFWDHRNIRSVEVKNFEPSFPDQKCQGFRVFQDVGNFISWPKLDPRVPCWNHSISHKILACSAWWIIQDSHVVKKIRVNKSRRFDKIWVLLYFNSSHTWPSCPNQTSFFFQ